MNARPGGKTERGSTRDESFRGGECHLAKVNVIRRGRGGEKPDAERPARGATGTAEEP